MERIYKIYANTNKNHFVLYISATTDKMPFYVWRDIGARCGAVFSSDIKDGIGSGYSQYGYVRKDALDKAVAVLNGALFKEATPDEWEKWKSGVDKE